MSTSPSSTVLVRARRASPPAAVPTGRDQVDDPLVERAIRDLRRLVVGGQIELVLQVGEYLIKHFYGSAAEAASRRPGKAASLDRLAARADEFGMSASGVRRAVPITIQAHALGRDLALRLPPTHHRVLLPLRRREEKRLLAEAAIEGDWTVERLTREARRVQKRHPGGRPARPFAAQIVDRGERLAARVTAAQLQDGLDDIEPAAAGQLIKRLARVQAALVRVERALATRTGRA